MYGHENKCLTSSIISESRNRSIILRTTDLERLTLEVNAIKCHGTCGFLNWAKLREKQNGHLQRTIIIIVNKNSEHTTDFPNHASSTYLTEGKVLVHVNLHTEHWEARGWAQASLHHLFIEELAHGLFGDAKGDVSHVQSACLPGHLTGCRLRGWGYRQGSSSLTNGWRGNTHGRHLPCSCWEIIICKVITTGVLCTSHQGLGITRELFTCTKTQSSC